MRYYIASCMFTSRFPELGMKIASYAESKGLTVIRCCVPGWKVQKYVDRMPEGSIRERWAAFPHTAEFKPGDEIYVLCANCNNIIEERNTGAKIYSIFELIDEDKDFRFPDFNGETVTLQDCWRWRQYENVQNSVRSLLKKMNMNFVDTEKNKKDADFCGLTLYKPQLPRNYMLAPKHYAENIEGLFLPHTEEEQKAIMTKICSGYKTERVVCYCHYCLEGLLAGGAKAKHIMELLFENY